MGRRTAAWGARAAGEARGQRRRAGRTSPRTLGATLALTLAGALCAPVPAAEPLVDQDLPAGSATKRHSAGAGTHARAPALADVQDLAHYAGRANPAPALRTRAFTLTVPGTGETLRFEDLVRGEIDGGYTLTTALDAEGPRLELVVLGSTVHGTVSDGEDLYVLTPLGGRRTLVHRQGPGDVEAPPHAAPHEHPVPEEARAVEGRRGRGQAHRAAPTAKAAGPATVDVLFVHDDLAAERAGDMRAHVALMLLKVNQMFARSHVAARIRSDGLHRTEYAGHDRSAHFPQGHVETLARLRLPGDGYMDEVHDWRESAGADVVALLVGTGEGSCGGGVAHPLTYHEGERRDYQERYGFVVSGVGGPGCVQSDPRTLGHELIHLHGALHNPELSTGAQK